MMRAVAGFATALLLATPSFGETIQMDGIKAPGAILRALDKVTGATEDITLASGTSGDFERLRIGLVECRYPRGNRQSKSFALLSITDLRVGSPAFEGWMFAESPALSALEHPRYDIWVLRCTTS